MPKNLALSAVDLFGGAGGLGLGVARSGFDVRVAVEMDKEAVNTYKHNHPKATVLARDIREVSGNDLLALTPGRKVGLLMGCAPCQGFCSLTTKQKREDPRNALVLEMARLVEEIEPDAVLMENVPGLLTRGKALFYRFVGRLRDAGYSPQWWIVQMADYGVPQNRRRLVLLAGRGFAINLPKATHSRRPKSGEGLRPWRTLRDAIEGERAPLKLSSAVKGRGPRSANWHVVRDLRPQTRARLRASIPGGTWLEFEDELRPKCHRGDYEGFRNVYGRMSWDQLPVTVTAGCTTPAKGRFGHPDRRRTTISVREAATLQTFPKSFRFVTDKIDVVCEMIGNAVPPLFGEHLGRECRKALAGHHDALARRR